MSESPPVRISVSERERALMELSWHFSIGTLSMGEFDQRSDQAMRADTREQLAVLFTDLPRAPVSPPANVDTTLPRVAARTGAVCVLAVALWLIFGSELWLLLLLVVPLIVLAGVRR